MSAIILDGKKVRDERLPKLKAKVSLISRKPVLAIIQVGDRPDSTAYIHAKKVFADKLGIMTKHIHVPEGISQDEMVKIISENNLDSEIAGIIVQLPLPIALDRDSIINTIDPSKDVDGLTAQNVKSWLEGREDAIMPATARGIKTLLKYYNIDLFGKKVCVLGRSMLVGKPIAMMCLNENATVSVCHSKTADLEKETRNADILIVAIGKPKFINKNHVREGQVVVDVGISKDLNGNLSGDVDFLEVEKIAKMITPVPGGVGPMTVISLFENLIDLCSFRDIESRD